MSKRSIDLDKMDADLLQALSAYVEPLFAGIYQPDYLSKDNMASLSWDKVSPLAGEEANLIFTLDGHTEGQITGLFLNLDGVKDPQIMLELVDSGLSQLTALKELVLVLYDPSSYGDHQVVSLPKLGTNPGLRLLYLKNSSNQPIMIDQDLSVLTNLVVFQLDGPISMLPRGMENWTKLQRFVCRNYQQVETFPKSIFDCYQLRWLEFGDRFDSIDPELRNLNKLGILDIRSKHLQLLPDVFDSLTSLRHLSIETPELNYLPESLGTLEHITDLYLWEVPIETIPPAVLELSTLRYLWVKAGTQLRGSLKTIPAGIGNLSNLKELQCNGHFIEELPDTIGQLRELEVLNLGINELHNLPSEIYGLDQLRRLELYSNKLTGIDEEIGNLDNLVYLDISDNQINSLPLGIGELSSLTDVDLLDLPLSSLPPSISKLNIRQFNSLFISMTTPLEKMAEENPATQWLLDFRDWADQHGEDVYFEFQLYEE